MYICCVCGTPLHTIYYVVYSYTLSATLSFALRERLFCFNSLRDGTTGFLNTGRHSGNDDDDNDDDDDDDGACSSWSGASTCTPLLVLVLVLVLLSPAPTPVLASAPFPSSRLLRCTTC